MNSIVSELCASIESLAIEKDTADAIAVSLQSDIDKLILFDDDDEDDEQRRKREQRLQSLLTRQSQSDKWTLGTCSPCSTLKSFSDGD